MPVCVCVCVSGCDQSPSSLLPRVRGMALPGCCDCLQSVYDFDMLDLDEKPRSMSEFRGKVMV